MSAADEIWNRACFRKSKQPRAGDAALEALLRFHSAAMNGGIDHASESLTAKEVSDAAVGYRYFGFARVSELVSEAPKRLRGLDDDAHEELLASVSQIYSSEIPSDATLLDRFHRHFEANPGEYEPVS